jgi:predicted nucleotidyltransferase
MVENLDFKGLPSMAANKIRPFFEEVMQCCPEKVHSVYVTGSAVTPDFRESTSDVNSLIVLNDLHFEFFKFLAPLGKKFKSKGIAAPRVMTPSYIQDSLDVFPMEFLELRLIHKTALGPDIVQNLEIDPVLLRLQCEREIKTRLIGLWNGYISSTGETDMIAQLLYRSIKGCMPLFRSIVFLLGKLPPIKKMDVIGAISDNTGIDKDILIKALLLKESPIKNREELLSLFERYYGNLETVAGMVNALQQ